MQSLEKSRLTFAPKTFQESFFYIRCSSVQLFLSVLIRLHQLQQELSLFLRKRQLLMPWPPACTWITRIQQVNKNICRPCVVQTEILPAFPFVTRKAKINQRYLISVIHYICNADIAVHHTPAVQIFQDVKELCPDPEHFL